MKKSWVCEVEQAEDGEYFIQLTDEMLENSGFKIGDDFIWHDNKDGSFTLTKKQENVWVMVEAIQSYRMRYLVQAPADHPEYAMDDVTCMTAKEFSQLALPEVITSHRVVTEEEALRMCDEDNDYVKSWNSEQKMRAFFTKEGENNEHNDIYYDTDRNR
jgi:hypothetical protein